MTEMDSIIKGLQEYNIHMDILRKPDGSGYVDICHHMWRIIHDTKGNYIKTIGHFED